MTLAFRSAAMAIGLTAACAAAPAFAQLPGCWTMGNMALCQDGRMMMNGVWFAPQIPPAFVFQSEIGPGESAMWSWREFTNPDGSRTRRWERVTRGADGVERRERRDQVIYPDGRVCEQDPAAPRCP